MILDNGITLQGLWNNDELLEGRITYPDGSVYEGQIRGMLR